MSHFEDNYVEFLADVMAEDAIEVRRELVELLGEDTPIYEQLDMLLYSESPIECRLSDFDLQIISTSDMFLRECGVDLVDPTSLTIRTDVVRTIKEVGFHLDQESILDAIENSCNAIDAFGELCAMFGSLDPVIYINHLHFVAPESIADIATNARNKLDNSALALDNDISLLNKFSRYIQELDERTVSHILPFIGGISDTYTLFEHGMGLYKDEIVSDLEDDTGIACIKMAILYAISKDKESIGKDNLVEDLTTSIGSFISTAYLNKLVLMCFKILTEVLSYDANA